MGYREFARSSSTMIEPQAIGIVSNASVARIASVVSGMFPYDRFDRFGMFQMIQTIIWKPGLRSEKRSIPCTERTQRYCRPPATLTTLNLVLIFILKSLLFYFDRIPRITGEWQWHPLRSILPKGTVVNDFTLAVDKVEVGVVNHSLHYLLYGVVIVH